MHWGSREAGRQNTAPGTRFPPDGREGAMGPSAREGEGGQQDGHAGRALRPGGQTAEARQPVNQQSDF